MNSPGFSADLTSFDLLDLVQVVHIDRRDLCLVVRFGAQTLGLLRFEQGELLWAECGELMGEAAFLALAALQSGSLEQLSWSGESARNVFQPLSRLIMQAVAYRDAQQGVPQAETVWSSDDWTTAEPGPPGSARQGSYQRPVVGPLNERADGMTDAGAEEPPNWMQPVQATLEELSTQPTGAMPQTPVPPPLEVPTPPLAQPVLLTGRRGLLGWAAGARAATQAAPATQTAAMSKTAQAGAPDPPTVPLPAVQNGLKDYAPQREELAPLPESFPEPGQLVPESVPVPASASSSPAALEPGAPQEPKAPGPATSMLLALAAGGSVSPPAPDLGARGAGEAQPGGLSLLEQLAYGRSSSAAGAEQASPPLAAPAPSPLSPAPAGPAQAAPALALPPSTALAPLPLPAASAAPEPLLVPTPVAPVPAAPAPLADTGAPAGLARAALAAEAPPTLRQVLEAFAVQVGSAFLATALLTAAGKVVAQHIASKRTDQDLASPAYHLAQVMQSSLRALLMGGWGDLDETLITGSTHSIVLRRLGQVEQSLFHLAVLERSGNPGLCRVLMRQTEPVLLRLAASS